MGTMASQPASSLFTQPFIRVQIKETLKSTASLAAVRGIHRGPVNSPHKWPVTRKMFPFDDVVMCKGKSWFQLEYAQHINLSKMYASFIVVCDSELGIWSRWCFVECLNNKRYINQNQLIVDSPPRNKLSQGQIKLFSLGFAMYRVEKGSFKFNWNLGVYIYDSIPELTILLCYLIILNSRISKES